MTDPLCVHSRAGDMALAALFLQAVRIDIIRRSVADVSGQAFTYSARKPDDSGAMLLKFQSMVRIADRSDV